VIFEPFSEVLPTYNVRNALSRQLADQLQIEEDRSKLQPLPPSWRQTPAAKPADILEFKNMKGSFQPPLKVYDDLVALAS